MRADRFAVVGIVTIAVVVIAPRSSRADEDAEREAAALFQQAERDEQGGDYARALKDYEASFARSASGRYAARASFRAGVLRDHAEGGFAPFARLERVRRDPALANDPTAVDALARDADAFPPGRVRGEARMLVAEAYLGRLGRRADGVATLAKIVDDPSADVLTTREAAREIVEADLAGEDIDRAVRDAHAHANKLEPAFIARVERLSRRRVLRAVAWASVGVVVALAGAAIARAGRRKELARVGAALGRYAPLALAFVAFVGLAGGALASSYESGSAKPFLAFGVALAPVALLARAWGVVGSPRRVATVARALACALCVLGCAFLVLETLDPTYLEGFGL